MQTTAIITIYNRVNNLEKQIKALKDQTTTISKYIFCVNNLAEKEKYTRIIKENLTDYLIIEHSENLGVWNRFFLAFNSETEIVYILDDDVIPGNERIEKATNELEKKEMIIGSWGSLFNSLENRRDRTIISETNRTDRIKKVDMSGQSWIFRKETLPKMFCYLPENISTKYKVCGEELLISWNARKYGINTYVLDMNENKETWGNKEPNLGHDQHSGFNKYGNNLYQEFYLEIIKEGFLPLNFLNNEHY